MSSPIKPPAPIQNEFDLRIWLAGCAMSNPNIVNSPDPIVAAEQALKAADSLLLALQDRPLPQRLNENVDLTISISSSNKETVPSPGQKRGKKTKPPLSHAPTLAQAAFTSATEHLRKIEKPESGIVDKMAGFYSVTSDDNKDR